MPSFWVIFAIMLAVVLLAMAAGQAWLRSSRRREAVQLLREPEMGGPGATPAGDAPAVFLPAEQPAAGLDNLPGTRRLRAWLGSVGSSWSVGGLLAASASLALIGAVAGWLLPVFIFRTFSALMLAAGLGATPTLLLARKRARRLREFEEQFPDALDFLARATSAGHAFSGSLEMLAGEADEPIRSEFRRVFHEQNLGAPLDGVLRSLAARVPIVDVKFFVAAVLLQRETGGNLSEMLTKLGRIMRERFRLKGHIRAVTAHGRITAVILTLLPIVLAASLAIRAPKYMDTFVTDFHGRIMAATVIVLQIIGYLIMRKMVNFRV